MDELKELREKVKLLKQIIELKGIIDAWETRPKYVPYPVYPSYPTWPVPYYPRDTWISWTADSIGMTNGTVTGTLSTSSTYFL